MSATNQIAPPEGNSEHARGGRRGGRGQGNNSQHGSRGGRSARGGGRNAPHRGQTGHSQFSGRLTTPNQPPPGAGRPPPQDLGGGGSSGMPLTEAAKFTEGEGGTETAGDDVDGTDGEVCFICASSVVHQSVGPCNHRTCHICALRLRALYKSRACAHCRTEAEYVIFTDDSSKKFEDFTDEDFKASDGNLGIRYENLEIHKDTLDLLKYNCPDSTCEEVCYGWPHLHRHVKSAHNKAMCDLCTRNKKVFTHEHELFTPHELRTHQKFGDDNPGAVDQSGFRGHPECGFCRERFYGDDELYTHCRDKHEKCHICDRRNGGRNPQYYVNYESLEKHFGKDHYLCLEQDCLDKKFVVFESEMDLKAHQLESHANSLSKDVRRDARLVDMSTFDYRERYQDNRGGRRGRGRGRDPNAEPIPASSAQPMRRDELAFQRQMAIQSAQSVSNRTFGGQLTTNTASQTPMAVSTTARPQSTQTDIPIENLNIRSEVVPTTDLTPQEQARRIQHGAVMDRASALLQNEPTKISDFRARVSSYKNSAITATELIDAFFALFDVSPTDLGKLIKELASIYENESKRSDLLKAWNDWRAINEDYPSLPGPDASIPTAAPVGGGGRRILKLKSSTAQSSRSAVNREVAWGNQAPPGAAVFPSLAAAANRIGRGRVGTTPWATATTSSAPRPNPTIRMSAAPASSAPKANLGGSDAFPALPATAKPNTSIFGLHRGTVRWDDNKGQALSNPWASGANSGANASGTASEAEADEGAGAKGGKKKQKKGKEVLYKFG